MCTPPPLSWPPPRQKQQPFNLFYWHSSLFYYPLLSIFSVSIRFTLSYCTFPVNVSIVCVCVVCDLWFVLLSFLSGNTAGFKFKGELCLCKLIPCKIIQKKWQLTIDCCYLLLLYLIKNKILLLIFLNFSSKRLEIIIVDKGKTNGRSRIILYSS